MIKRHEMISFRIVPDRTVSNRKTHDFMRAIHDFNQGLRSRISIQEKKIQDKARFFWDIIMTKDGVEFVCTVPRSKASFTKQQLELIWEKAAITEMNVCYTKPEDDQAEVCEMRMTKHNIFSLHVDRRFETEPLGSLLIGTKEMKEDDYARIQIMCDPVPRLTWQDVADKKYQDFSKGKSLRRMRISKKDMLIGAGDSICFVLDKASESLDTVMDAISGRASERDQEIRDRIRDADKREKRVMLLDGGLSRETNKKKTAPTFKTWIRVVAVSKDEGRRKSLINTLTNGFSDLNGDNELERSELSRSTQKRILREVVSWSPSLKTLYDPDHMVMSCNELGRFVEMPTAKLQDNFKFESIGKREVNVPKEFSKGIPWGEVTYKGTTRTIYLPIDNWGLLCRPHAAFGKMFTGKSTLGARMGYLFPTFGFTSILMDTADGKLIDDARDGLPEDFPESHIIDLDFGNLMMMPSSDWNEMTSTLKTEGGSWGEMEMGRRQASNRLSSILVNFIDKLATKETTDRMERYLSAVAKAILSNPKRGILEVITCLTSDEYRANVLKNFKISDPIVFGTIKELHEMSEDARNQIVRSIMTRLNVLLSSDYMRNSILQQPKCGPDGKPLINVRKWIDGDPKTNPKYNGAYFIGIRIPKSLLFDDATDRLATFWDAKVWLAALSRYDLPIMNGCHGRPFVYIRDEPHQTPSAFNIHDDSCREARKWGMKNFWLAHKLEDFDHMKKTLKDAGVQYSVYATSKETAKSLTEELHPFEYEELLRIPQQYWAVNSFAQSDQAFLCKMFDVEKVKDRSYLRKRCSEKFGRPLHEVEKEIFERTSVLFAEADNKNKKKVRG
jgi:hypothetical protein